MNARDATKTATLRNSAISECNARFGNLSRAIKQAFPLVEDKSILLTVNVGLPSGGSDRSRGRISRRRASLGLAPSLLSSPSSSPTPGLRIPRRYTFQRSPETIPDFESWLQEQIDYEILQPTIPIDQKWLASRIGAAYSKGAASARNSARPAARRLGRELPDSSPFLNRAHIDRSSLIFTRNFNGLEGISDAMKSEMRRVITDGVLRGHAPREIARNLEQRINVGRARANRIVRTEIIQAHQEASLIETAILEAELGIEFQMQWLTTKDGRQRDSHTTRDGKLYSKEEANSLLGEPNCRCAIFPYIDLSRIGK